LRSGPVSTNSTAGRAPILQNGSRRGRFREIIQSSYRLIFLSYRSFQSDNQADKHRRSRGARRPRLADRLPSRNGGRRESRVPSAPAVMRKNAHDGPQVRRNTRPSLRSGFNGLWRALPGDEFVLPPSLTDWRSIEARSGSTLSISLTPATGAGTTRFCRPQLPSRGAPTGLMCCRPKFPARAFKRRSSARHSIAHKSKLTLRTHRAPTLPRPPQPAPTFVTTADAPLAGQDGGILLLICPTG